MKAHGFLQIIPERDSQGRTRSLKPERITQKYPYSPLPGAIVVKIAVDIPDEIAAVQTAEAAIEAGVVTMWFEPTEVGEPVGAA